MTELVTNKNSFDELFTRFRHTAFRLEVRTKYGVAEEDAAFQSFLAGKTVGTEWFQPWLDLMRKQTARGKRIERVRIVDRPPSDYLRFEISNTEHNLDAGEDIRYLLRHDAEALALPHHDFWLFDDDLVVSLQFSDEDDRFLGFSTSRAQHVVREHAEWRNLAWKRALDFTSYTRCELTSSGGQG
jgi:hypothetical protein